jgi:hypothetical protein
MAIEQAALKFGGCAGHVLVAVSANSRVMRLISIKLFRAQPPSPDRWRFLIVSLTF